MDLTTRVDRLEDGLSALAEAAARSEAALTQLAEAQGQTQAELRQLAEAQGRHEARTGALEAAVIRLAEAQTQTQAELRQLVAVQKETVERLGTLLSWQVGEDGRRKGERHERYLLRRAWNIFRGGQGGTTEEYPIRTRLTELLRPILPDNSMEPNEDPFLADLLWWKGDQVAVVEASLVVDEDDVNRAWHRAETMQRAGLQALAVVIGDAWDSGETRVWAQAHRVEWWVGSELSEGFIAFRRLPA